MYSVRPQYFVPCYVPLLLCYLSKNCAHLSADLGVIAGEVSALVCKRYIFLKKNLLQLENDFERFFGKKVNEFLKVLFQTKMNTRKFQIQATLYINLPKFETKKCQRKSLTIS